MKKKIKRLHKSKKEKIVGGVCGGIAEYLNIDPTLIRLLWVLVTIFTGFVLGILVYIIALIMVPEKR